MKKKQYVKTVTFAGNPNVGKTTLFNSLTGMKQHTGNWAGKTVALAEGCYEYENLIYKTIDLPGTYSLIANSKEERCAGDYICFGKTDVTVIVCDATNIERNLTLVLQILEITDKAILCINFSEEAEKKGIQINYKLLSEILNIPVLPICAKNKKGLEELKKEISKEHNKKSFKVNYSEGIEEAVLIIEKALKGILKDEALSIRWIATRILCNDLYFVKALNTYLGTDLTENKKLRDAIIESALLLKSNNINLNEIRDKIVSEIVMNAEGIYFDAVSNVSKNSDENKSDKFFTNKWIAYPFMFLLLCVTFWITLIGADFPSQLLGEMFGIAEKYLVDISIYLNVPSFLYEMLIFGVFRITGWVISVMLPPMVIFFPLFTLMEESGILPRIAFNFDGIFKKCNTCGKQSLTMCMGFGCNSVGVSGCRIMDSERERLISIITNSLVPCNGRFPAIITLIILFFTGVNQSKTTFENSVYLALFILLGILLTFVVSKILSVTLLKGESSSYVMEIPPLRKPKIISTIIRALYDRALSVLGRAIIVAAPAGLIIWLLSNININGVALIRIFADTLNPFGVFLGLDGVILLAFILGFPANEIVIPVMLMTYLSGNTLVDYDNLNFIKNVLIDNGWTFLTAFNTIIFTLFHFPCSTTLLTIKKETGSIKWTLISFLTPLMCGIILCLLVKLIFIFI